MRDFAELRRRLAVRRAALRARSDEARRSRAERAHGARAAPAKRDEIDLTPMALPAPPSLADDGTGMVIGVDADVPLPPVIPDPTAPVIADAEAPAITEPPQATEVAVAADEIAAEGPALSEEPTVNAEPALAEDPPAAEPPAATDVDELAAQGQTPVFRTLREAAVWRQGFLAAIIGETADDPPGLATAEAPVWRAGHGAGTDFQRVCRVALGVKETTA